VAPAVGAARPRPRLEDGWDHAPWAGTEALAIASFRPEGSDHRPRTRARLVHDDEGLGGIFRIEDRYVRSVHTRFGEPVYRDSCVEIFLQPKPDRGYLNFEMNAGGTLLASHITDHRRTPDGFAAVTRLAEADGRRVSVRSSLPALVDPEVEDPLEWQLSFYIPKALLEKYVGPIGSLGGQRWRANLYKCGDGTSHPHWASWSPVDALNFHLPHCFGRLVFEP
jgi:hypothetical protein